MRATVGTRSLVEAIMLLSYSLVDILRDRLAAARPHFTLAEKTTQRPPAAHAWSGRAARQ